MEIQRALVITGIAVVSYLMIQAWQRDHADSATPVPVEQVAEQGSSSSADSADLPAPQPETENSIPAAQADGDQPVEIGRAHV